MVTGLIVDTFSNLRKELDEFNYDLNNNCFICGLNREYIEKIYSGKDGFIDHINNHNLRNYFCYIFYLMEKNPNDYTGMESYIKNMIDINDNSWIPCEKCLLEDKLKYN